MSSLSSLVDRSGGLATVARILQVPAEAMRVWLHDDRAPEAFHLRLWKLAVVSGVDWSPPDCDAFVLRSKYASSDDAAPRRKSWPKALETGGTRVRHQVSAPSVKRPAAVRTFAASR